jgi:hypothetical protein
MGDTMRALAHATAAAACLAAASAAAEEPAPDKWEFSIAPYVWATALNGDLALRGRRADIDASFIDILQDTDSIIGLEGRFEVRKGSWGGYVDGIYNRLGAEETFERQLRQPPENRPIRDRLGEDRPSSIEANVDVVNELAIVEAAVFYRIGKWALETSPDATRTGTPSLAIEPYAGARYTYLGVDLDISTERSTISDDGNEDWVDPIIGARFIIDLSERWQLLMGGDVGGFGVGSDFTWSALGLVGYEFPLFGAQATAVGGYKALYQDFDDGSGATLFKWDMTLHGPIIGLVILF